MPKTKKTEISDKARELQRAYQKKWRQANPDKIRQYTRNYWERKAREAEQETSPTE